MQSGGTDDRVRITPRTALIFLLALLAGSLVGLLTYIGGDSVAAAVLAGLATTGASVFGFDAIVDSAPR